MAADEKPQTPPPPPPPPPEPKPAPERVKEDRNPSKDKKG